MSLSSRTTTTAAALAATALGLALAATPAEAEAQARPLRADHARLRFAVGGEGGFFAGSLRGGLGGVQVRAGVQLNDLFGVYVQGQGLIGGMFDTGPDVAGFAYHSLMADVTLANVFQFGAGPSIDFIWGCEANRGQGFCARSGPYLGGDLRAAVLLGGNDSDRRRSALALSLDLHPTWFSANEASVALLFGAAVELY